MSEKRKILIVGYRKELIEACERLGIRYVNIVDAWDEPDLLPPCKNGDVRISTPNNTFDEEMISALARSKEEKFDAVCTTDEYFVVITSLLGSALSTPFLSPKVAVAFRDKYYQKSLIRGKIPVADSWFIDDVNTHKLEDAYSYPIVLKPTAGAGAAYTYKISSFFELEGIIKKHKENSNYPKSMLIEEFIHGEEWHLDGWTCDGELQLLAVSKYGKPIIEIKNGWIANSVTLRPELHKEIYSRLRLFTEETLDILGLEDGVFHLEVFFDVIQNKFIFSEGAARVAGYTPESIENTFGIDLHEILIKISLGEKVKYDEVATNYYTGWTLLPYLGAEKKMPHKEKILELPGVVKVQYNWKIGQPIPDTTEASTESVGLVLVQGESELEVRERINNVIENFKALTV